MSPSISRRSFLGVSAVGAASLCFNPVFALGPDPSDAINPLIGASTSRELGEGKTFPGPATPFGLVQLGPDTMTGGDNASGYSYDHTTIEGFSFARMSGVGWYGDFGNLMMMPSTGPRKLASGRLSHMEEGWRSPFRHETETVVAGYYAVTLDRYEIRAELAAAQHAGILRFTFPESDQSRIQIDLARRIGGTSTRQFVTVVDENAIEGWMRCPQSGGGWGNGDGHVNYTVYFRAEFSKPLKKFGVWSVDMNDFDLRGGDGLISDQMQSEEFYRRVAQAQVFEGRREMEGDHLGFFTEFATDHGERVLVKAGISFVDIEGARKNLRHDIPEWGFDRVRVQAAALWDDALARVQIEGATKDQEAIFATAMYHAMIDPRKIADVDGRYLAGDGKIHTAQGYTPRTIFSGWDVFRGEMPLMTLVNPAVVNDQINSLVELAELSGKGYLERWEIMNAYSGCMDGDPATAVIVDAYAKGIRKFDVEKAYAACRQTAAGVGSQTNRPDNDFYLQHGYVPGQVSWTLDNAYFDWCVGRLAGALGKQDDAVVFAKRSQNYRGIYDSSVESMRAKDREGRWIPWKGKTKFGQGCTESNPLQQTWFVPHDVQGLIALMGGQEKFAAALEDFFEKTPEGFGWNPYYNHSNEPVHHVPYLFVYAGKPWLTQKWARRILEGAYRNAVNGIVGNDDVGQMSAWYVLGAMGFYPVCPGDGIYILGSPLFRKVTIALDAAWYKGGSFTIVTTGNSARNCYIQSARLNGKLLRRAWIRHEEIVSGGVLELVMGPEPERNWASELPSI